MQELSSRLASPQILPRSEEKVSNTRRNSAAGTQRRKKKHVNVQNVNEDKKLKSAIKKFGKCLSLCLMTFSRLGVQPLQDIDEVNMFKDDNTVIHFKRPASKIYHLSANLIPLSPVLSAREPDGCHRQLYDQGPEGSDA